MILTPEKLSWLRLLLRVRGTILSQIWRRLLSITLLACAITWMHEVLNWFTISLSPLPFTVMGLALSIFLGFRNSTSYERYWEGRRLWGGLVNTSRNLSRRILTLVGSAEADQSEALSAHQQSMVYLVIAWAHSLRSHLRGDELTELSSLLSKADLQTLKSWKHPPLYLAQRLGEMIQQASKKGWIHPLQQHLLEDPLSELINIQGGCERIRNTPIPLAYIVLLHQLAVIYCLVLPFGLVEDLKLYTPLMILIVAYAFLGLDAIGDSIENPFEFEDHDLPLSSLCRTIESNLRQQLGETDLPPALVPDDQDLLM